MRTHTFTYRLVAALGMLCGGLTLAGQTNANKSTIAGLVSDSGGAAIAGAKVTATSDVTGLARTTESNRSGAYSISALDPGTYSLSVESDTAGASVRKIVLSVGDSIQVNVELSVDAKAQALDVSTSSAAVTEPSASELLDTKVIDGLPINGRRFQDFATLAPGVQQLTQTRNQLSFSGQRGIYSNVMVEGSDYNEPFLGGIRGGDRSSFAFTIPQAAVQEFQVVESGYASEYGRSTGGLLNVVTRSGSNAMHGQAFYQARPSGIALEDPYHLQPLGDQQQFGASLGGPVLRDRMFFFGAGEFQLAGFNRNVWFPQLDQVASNVTPDIAPAYQYFRSLQTSYNQTNNVAALFGRVDYQLSGGSRITGRFDHSQNHAKNAVSPDIVIDSQTNHAFSSNGSDRDYTDTATVQYTAVMPAGANDLRFQYSKERHPQTSNSASPFVEAGTIGTFGAWQTLPGNLSDYRAQVSDGLSILRGRHSASFGADYSYISASALAGSNQYGSFIIDNSDVRQVLRILSGVGMNRFDDPSVSYLRQVGDLQQGAHAHQAALFGQDNWRISPAFTLNFGVRWEGQVNPSPALSNSFLVDNVQNFQFPLGKVNPSVIRSQLNQLAPRVSFAWDPSGKGDTVVRGSGGLFYGQTPLAWLAGPASDFSSMPSDLTLQVGPAGGNTVYQQFLAGGFDLNQAALGSLPVFTVGNVWTQVAGQPNPFAQANVITTSANNFRNPRSAQMSLVVQHKVSRGLVVDYQLSHLNTVHLERNVDYNVPAPFVAAGDLSLRPVFGLLTGTARPNANLGAVLVRDSSAHSNYTGNTFRATYKTKRAQLSAHYTLSFNKSNDDNERQLTEINYQNPFNFSRDYNWSNLDARHQAAGYGTWFGPYGFEVSALFQYRSGLPIDAITGADSAQLLTPNFGSRPLVAPGVVMLRNSFRNGDFKTVDLRIAKDVRRTDRTTIKVYAEGFNLFNWKNIGFIPANLYLNNPAFVYGPGVTTDGRLAPVNAGFMRLRTAGGGYDPATTSQQGTPLEVQVGARFEF